MPEGAEITSGTIGEGHEEYSIATYARKFSLTRQTIINDDLNASPIYQANGVLPRLDWRIFFWSIFTANQRMSDGKKLFSADHKNLAATGSIISEDSLSAAELAMSEQMGLTRGTTNIVPNYLIVPTT